MLFRSCLLLCLFASSLTSSSALILAPTIQATSTSPISARSNNVNIGLDIVTKKSIKSMAIARVRSIRRTDVDPVADLLSTAIMNNGPDPTTTQETWKARVERLRVKSSIRNTLDLRVRAMKAGKKYFTATNTQTNDDPNYYDLQQLWSNNSFRRNIEQAAELTSEPSPWSNYNFEVAPKDPSWLKHEMISAQDIATGDIIGFCEIAMLSRPSSSSSSSFQTTISSPPENDNNIDFQYGDDYDDEISNDIDFCAPTEQYAPTIANLVVSPSWRGRGVGKGLLKSAERIVQRKWNCGELGLYVENSNLRAMKLYVRSGYNKVPLVSINNNSPKQDFHSFPSQCYMSKSLL